MQLYALKLDYDLSAPRSQNYRSYHKFDMWRQPGASPKFRSQT